MKPYFYLFLWILFSHNLYGENKQKDLRSGETRLHSYVSASVLSSGKWVKIRVSETGIYKLSYEELSQMGFSDPTKVQVYGYGGWILNENFSLSRIDDLPRLKVWVERNPAAGSSYILFYAKGPVKWQKKMAKEKVKFLHTNNPYSDYGFYFLTESKENTSQMPVNNFKEDFEQELDTFDDYALHEKDLINIGHTGREFYGEDFSYNTSQNFTFSISGITNDKGSIEVNFVAKAATATPLTVTMNSGNTLSGTIGASIGKDNQYTYAREVHLSDTWHEEKKEVNTVNITYGAAGHTNARLNYIRLNFKRKLQPYGAYTFFRDTTAMNVATKYILSNAGQHIKIWNITDGENVFQMETKLSGTNLFFTSDASSLEEFVAVDLSKSGQFPTPEIVGEVRNQNLHGLSQTDMVIITHPDFTEQAERIAELHRTHDNLRVHVIEPELIYNEFSSGTPDATAYRWLMKMFYDRGKALGDENELPKYLLLFGDGTFDNKLIHPEWKGTEPGNKLLTYQSSASLVETSSYVVDDYFGFLDDDEGKSLQNERLDIGIGRFPVRTVEEAKNVTDKVINYVKNPIYGTWKNNVCFVADDTSGSDTRFIHMTQADELATNYVEKNNKDYILHKVYLETFQPQTTANGYTYPDATKKLHNLLKSGVLMVNYTGHGSTTSWAEEQIYTANDAQTLPVTKLPLFVTATCDFTRFDDIKTSAGEYVLLNPNGGGIALFSTTRVVFGTNNFNINKEFCNYIFSKKEDGTRLRLGDIMRLAKRAQNLQHDSNKLSFILIGDPALTLAYPEYKAEIITVNGKEASEEEEIFSAGSTISLTGRIMNPDGSRSESFNGIAHLNIYDAEEVLFEVSAQKKIYDRKSLLFTGKDSVSQGAFSFNFVVPKDISYSYKQGRINIYASDTINKKEAQGYFDNFIVGGTDEAGMNDKNPPVIHEAYLNHPEFRDGDFVNDTPVFFAEVEDETGINISGNGIGHDATVLIDNSPYNVYVINEYFESGIGNPGKGTFRFPLPTLSSGKHNLTFRVWDIMNNSSNIAFEFTVKEGLAPRLFRLSAIPNPAREVTNFYLTHDRPDNYMSVRIDVYSLSGQIVWSHTQNEHSSTFEAVPVRWELCNLNGQRLPPGIYVFRATISSNGSEETTEAKKLIILGQ